MRLTEKDCQACGACCGPPYVAPTYIDLTRDDVRRLPRGYRLRYVTKNSAPALQTKTTEDGIVCVALRGRIGTRVSCAIYERRPDACRRFLPGSRKCLALRAYAAIL